MADDVLINVARDFTRTPGPRYRTQGKWSGEEFREDFLENHFKDKKAKYKVIVMFDGTMGSPNSFVEEAFGGLARIYGVDWVLSRLEIISEEEPLLVKEIIDCIKEAKS